VKVLLQSVIGSDLSNMNQSELGALLGPSLYSQSSFRDGSRQRELGRPGKGSWSRRKSQSQSGI
jgi:hypothetical protein